MREATFYNAYQLRDTTIYGPLIQSDFTFTYHDFNNNVDITWGRDVEMNSTYNMFSKVKTLSFNGIILSHKSKIPHDQSQVVRRFDLVIVLKNSNILHPDGAAVFLLSRPDSTKPWRLQR